MEIIQRNRILIFDLFASLLLIGAVVFYASRYIDFSIPPFEDAAMLMRYADHLAHGYGIVWNVGERPVDGATDFLFMAVVAGFIKIGFSVGRAVKSLGFASHILTVLIVYWVNRRIWRTGISVSFIAGLYLAVGTGLAYVAAFFGTPFFALSAASAWTFALLLIQKENPPLWYSFAFALSGLAAGLVRPEGVVLAALMLVSVIVMRGWRKSAAVIAVFIGMIFILGGAYFVWRWNYFGYPLPNPFYKKGGGGLHWDSFDASFSNAIRLTLPFLLLFVLGFRGKETTRQTIAYLIPIIGFAASFVLISDEMNYGARFQYALVPMVLMSWSPIVSGLGLSWPRQAGFRARTAYLVAAVLASVALVGYSSSQNCRLTSFQRDCGIPYEADGRYDMGVLLSEYRGKGYVIATTEAGLLPFYSGWTAVDTWGLNDPWIAHNGEVTAAYLDQYKPHIIMFHAYYSPLVPPKLTASNLSQDWFRMTITMKDYAESHGYVLAAVFGDSPYDAHYYYVRPDFPDSERIVREISTMKKYYWFTTGKKSLNYAIYPAPSQ